MNNRSVNTLLGSAMQGPQVMMVRYQINFKECKKMKGKVKANKILMLFPMVEFQLENKLLIKKHLPSKL